MSGYVALVRCCLCSILSAVAGFSFGSMKVVDRSLQTSDSDDYVPPFIIVVMTVYVIFIVVLQSSVLLHKYSLEL